MAISPELGTFQCLALMAKLPTFAALLPLGYRVVRARGIKACVGSSAVNLRKSKINCYHFPTSHRVILDYMRTTCLTSVSGTSGISFLSTGSLWKREKICNPFLKGWVSRVSCDSQIVFQTLVSLKHYTTKDIIIKADKISAEVYNLMEGKEERKFCKVQYEIDKNHKGFWCCEQQS